ncbi:MAG: Ig domain-containing protein [Rikenellaceae bacterium]|nr:Ig domain-containing protein [Rikenellaceae bacterium]
MCTMKRFAFLLALCSMLFVACDKEQEPIATPDTIAVESVVVTPASCELTVDGEETLSVEVLPADAEYTLEWISTNSDIVTVAEGTIKGIAPGTAIVMAKAGDKTGNCTVTVVGTPVESITLNYHELELDEGGAFTLSATITPEDADNKSILWSSSAPDVVKVNGAGNLTALRPGLAKITAKAGNCTDECAVRVNAAPLAVGDFYYSDGSWSQSLDPTRTPIGVVFYVGDITATDPALKADHPYCTHGLVVALDEKIETGWQLNYQEYNDTVGRWVELNTDYETITSGFELSDNLNRPMGYNNTKAIEAFNLAEENASWKVEAVEYVVDYRTKVPAPETSSDWYLGSSKEMSLLVSGPYDQNIWEIRDQGITIENKKLVNKKLEQIEGAWQIGVQIPVMMFYWSSTEFDWEFAGLMMPMNGQMPKGFKSDNAAFYTARAILAF